MGAEQQAFRPSRREEKRLVGRMLAGEEEAFEEFADGYFASLYRFALRRLGGDEELAREIVQATTCKAVTRLASFRQEASLFTWLCACCRNEILMHFRSEGRRPPHVDLEGLAVHSVPMTPAEGGPEAMAMRRESVHLVHLTLDHLPARYARALEWKYLERLPVVEIAVRLGIGPKAAESLLTRAREAFRRGYARLQSPPVPSTPSRGRQEVLPV